MGRRKNEGERGRTYPESRDEKVDALRGARARRGMEDEAEVVDSTEDGGDNR
jgi:hypothetical protein